MRFTRSALLFLGGIAALASCEPQDSGQAIAIEPSEFMRFVEEEDGSGRLEAAIVRYEDEQKRIVDLVGALHVGDREYYEELNTLFLLHEAIKEKIRT